MPRGQVTFEDRQFKASWSSLCTPLILTVEGLVQGEQELEAQLKLVFPDLLFTYAQLEPQSLHYYNMEILISSFASLL